MRILILNDGKRGLAERVRMGFFNQLRSFEGVEYRIYGPKERSVEGAKHVPIEYSQSMMGSDLVKELKPDVMIHILWGPQARTWVPQDIAKCGVPFIIFETDHYAIKNIENFAGKHNYCHQVLSWYKTIDATLLLRRHYYSEEPSVVPAVWFPHSANDKEFYPDESIEKINK